MAEKFEIEIGDNGRPTSALPEPLQAFFQKEIDSAVARAAKKAASSASPVDLERLRALEDENQTFKRQEQERLQDYAKARELLEQQHTKKLQDVSSALESERQRAKTLARENLREKVKAVALQHRLNPDAASDFLASALGEAIDIDADLSPIRKVGDAVEPLDVEAFATQAIEDRPWFRLPPAAGGGARGGASTQGTTADVGKRQAYDAAKAAWAQVQNGQTLRALQEAQAALQE